MRLLVKSSDNLNPIRHAAHVYVILYQNNSFLDLP
jgi:hypothetical protein